MKSLFKILELNFFYTNFSKAFKENMGKQDNGKTLWCNFYMHHNMHNSFGNSWWPLKRFVYSVATSFYSLRGNVKNIRSDNGANFIAQKKELKAPINKTDKEKVMTEIIKKGIHFLGKFKPPSRLWMGGVWELLIKSVKRSIKAITLDRIFTEEALYTFLYEVESMLNNCPVTLSSDDINCYEALIPNHLMLGNSSSNHSLCKCQDEIYYQKK